MTVFLQIFIYAILTLVHIKMKKLKLYSSIVTALIMCVYFCACKNEKEKVSTSHSFVEIKKEEKDALQVQVESQEQVLETEVLFPSFNSIKEVDIEAQKMDVLQYKKEDSLNASLHIMSDLYFIGFAPASKIALLSSQEKDGTGYRSITLYIQDLVTDEVLWALAKTSEDNEDYYKKDGAKEFIQNNAEEIDNTLKTYGIKIMTPLYAPLPYEKGDIYLEASANIAPHANLEEIRPIIDYSIIAQNQKGQKKTIATQKDVYAYNVYVCGYIKSPYEERIALVLATESFGFEGSDMEYSILGCDAINGFN